MSDATCFLRAKVEFNIVCQTPLHIGAATQHVQLDSLDELDPIHVVRGYNDRPCIPGSTLRGWLRNITGLDQIAAEDVSRYPADAVNIDKLFGYPADENSRGASGCVDVQTAFANSSVADLRYSHGRDPITNTPKEHHLFAKEVLQLGTEFEVCLLINRIDEPSLRWLLSGLQSVVAGIEFALGGSKRNGFGRIEITNLRAAVLDKAGVSTWWKSPSDSMWAHSNTYELPSPSRAVTGWKTIEMSLFPQARFICEDAAKLEEQKSANDDAQVVRKPLLSKDGKCAIVPGATLKGALKAIARRQLNTEVFRLHGSLSADQVVCVTELVLDELFGSKDKAGRLSVSDFISENLVGKEVDRTRVMHASDRFTGGVSGEKLFAVDAVYAKQLHGTLEYREPLENDNIGAASSLCLGWVFRHVWHNSISLGWGVNRGFGEMKFANVASASSTDRFENWSGWIHDVLPAACSSDATVCFQDWINSLVVQVNPSIGKLKENVCG